MTAAVHPAAPSPVAQPSGAATLVRRAAPGVLLCALISGVAILAQVLEHRLLGRAWLEALVLAIVLGAGVRTAWTIPDGLQVGVKFSAHTLLEIAVVLLGASVSAKTLLSIGPAMLIGIAAVVALAIPCSYALGRLLGLPPRMATLVACGNSICGNSAIAAVAPVIGARGEDVACSIAFTAVLGVLVVLGLPVLGAELHLDALRYGALAGLTVYAVPQVLAATAPAGALAVQVGTLVKLVRVLMLGPVCCVLSLVAARSGDPETRGASPPLHKMVPWFILGFLAMAAARSLGLLPAATLGPIATAASLLTLLSMAALGLMTDGRAVLRAGGRTVGAVSLSLIVLGLISFGLISLVHLG